jgi:hypothetical protein
MVTRCFLIYIVEKHLAVMKHFFACNVEKRLTVAKHSFTYNVGKHSTIAMCSPSLYIEKCLVATRVKIL